MLTLVTYLGEKEAARRDNLASESSVRRTAALTYVECVRNGVQPWFRILDRGKIVSTATPKGLRLEWTAVPA